MLEADFQEYLVCCRNDGDTTPEDLLRGAFFAGGISALNLCNNPTPEMIPIVHEIMANAHRMLRDAQRKKAESN